MPASPQGFQDAYMVGRSPSAQLASWTETMTTARVPAVKRQTGAHLVASARKGGFISRGHVVRPCDCLCVDVFFFLVEQQQQQHNKTTTRGQNDYSLYFCVPDAPSMVVLDQGNESD